MEPFRAECFVDKEDHVWFQVEHRTIAIEPHVRNDNYYCCIDADQALALAAWLTEAVAQMDAAIGARGTALGASHPDNENRHPE